MRDLHTFNDAVVAFRAGAECLKRLLVSLAFVQLRDNPSFALGFDPQQVLRKAPSSFGETKRLVLWSFFTRWVTPSALNSR